MDKAKRGAPRKPRLTDQEKARRGTLQRVRAVAPAVVKPAEPAPEVEAIALRRRLEAAVEPAARVTVQLLFALYPGRWREADAERLRRYAVAYWRSRRLSWDGPGVNVHLATGPAAQPQERQVRMLP